MTGEGRLENVAVWVVLCCYRPVAFIVFHAAILFGKARFGDSNGEVLKLLDPRVSHQEALGHDK